MTERHEAYTAMFMRHRTMLWRMCWCRARGDRDCCCDLMQEVSIALWLNFDKLRPDASQRQERSWVRWQARSVLSHIGRQRKLTAEPLTDVLADSLADDDTLQRKELLDALLSALEPDERRMVVMHLNGYRGDEIGEQEGLSRDAVYQRIHRAMIKVRRTMLVVLALLLATMMAVAIVPQWRHAVFGRNVEGSDRVNPEILPLSMSQDVTVHDVESPVVRSEPRVERLPDLDVVELISQTVSDSDTMPVEFMPVDIVPTLIVNGSRLIVSGADGELVRIEDADRRLVYYDVCRGVYIIDLFLFQNISVFCPDRRVFSVKIGRYPEVYLKM